MEYFTHTVFMQLKFTSCYKICNVRLKSVEQIFEKYLRMHKQVENIWNGIYVKLKKAESLV